MVAGKFVVLGELPPDEEREARAALQRRADMRVPA
jgi:hypothetical protein